MILSNSLQVGTASVHITSLISLLLVLQPCSVEMYHQWVLSIPFTPLQSSGQGSDSSSAGTADFKGAVTFSATFSLVATFPPEPEVEPDTGVAGV